MIMTRVPMVVPRIHAIPGVVRGIPAAFNAGIVAVFRIGAARQERRGDGEDEDGSFGFQWW